MLDFLRVWPQGPIVNDGGYSGLQRDLPFLLVPFFLRLYLGSVNGLVTTWDDEEKIPIIGFEMTWQARLQTYSRLTGTWRYVSTLLQQRPGQP